MSRLEQYDYHLPPNLIATTKANPSDSSKLLVYDRKSGDITHAIFRDISSFIPQNTTMIFNNTKVFKARLFGVKNSGGKCELLLDKAIDGEMFQVLIKGKTKIGTILNFDDNLKAEVVEINDDGTRCVRFYQDNILDFNTLVEIMNKIGHTPLPPYIKREDNDQDMVDYQSIFAKHTGSVAAPTASLHFTPEVMQTLENIKKEYLTLHVGIGTFKGVESDDIKEHKMHSEYYSIDAKTEDIIKGDKNILAVGTTTARTIEYYARCTKPSGMCDIFLHPQNPPSRINQLLTNFHLPKSTLLMLVSSLVGIDKCKELYNIAIQKKYRFYSYGDAMLIL
jgi:S-adenosylmethionine:tRNA ribosyltransferase-isomerase